MPTHPSLPVSLVVSSRRAPPCLYLLRIGLVCARACVCARVCAIAGFQCALLPMLACPMSVYSPPPSLPPSLSSSPSPPLPLTPLPLSTSPSHRRTVGCRFNSIGRVDDPANGLAVGDVILAVNDEFTLFDHMDNVATKIGELKSQHGKMILTVANTQSVMYVSLLFF